MSALFAGQILKPEQTAGELVLRGLQQQVLLPVILLGVFTMPLMCILVVSEDLESKLLRKMEQSNVAASEFIYIGMKNVCP